jgi:hypothetical protein
MMDNQPDVVNNSTQTPAATPDRPTVRSGEWEQALVSGVIAGSVFAFSKSHMAFPGWLLTTGLAYSFCILNGNFRYSPAQKVVATLIMLGIGTYWREGLAMMYPHHP